MKLTRLVASGCAAAGVSAFLLAGAARSAPAPVQKPVSIIFDTDIGPDVDDAGTTAVLHALADRGEAKILAMGVCTSNEGGAPCLDAINTFFLRPDIPIGTLKKPGFLTDSKYAGEVARRYPNDLKSGANAPEVVDLYRRVLASQPDASVVMSAVGPLPNLAKLLESGADRHSPLSGWELVARKVTLLTVMGGRFPEGKEWNFEQDPPAAAKVTAEWPTPILFSGWEIGARIKTGARLDAEALGDNPVRAAYALYVGPGQERESWDQTAALAAVRNPLKYWTLSPPGRVTVDPKTAQSTFRAESGGRHRYLIESMPAEQVKQVIDELMLEKPG